MSHIIKYSRRGSNMCAGVPTNSIIDTAIHLAVYIEEAAPVIICVLIYIIVRKFIMKRKRQAIDKHKRKEVGATSPKGLIA